MLASRRLLHHITDKCNCGWIVVFVCIAYAYEEKLEAVKPGYHRWVILVYFDGSFLRHVLGKLDFPLRKREIYLKIQKLESVFKEALVLFTKDASTQGMLANVRTEVIYR